MIRQVLIVLVLVAPEFSVAKRVRQLSTLRKHPRTVKTLQTPRTDTETSPGPALEKEIQGFTLTEDGKSKILYLDLALLREMGIFSGNYKALSFGEDTSATLFNKVKVDTLDVEEIEKKLNQVLHPRDNVPAGKMRPGTTTINSDPVRVSLSSPRPAASALIKPSQHLPLPTSPPQPSQYSPLPVQDASPSSSDNSLETLAALKIARRKSLNI